MILGCDFVLLILKFDCEYLSELYLFVVFLLFVVVFVVVGICFLVLVRE